MRQLLKKKYLETLLAVFLAFLCLPILNHAFRAFFQCSAGCSALRLVSSPWLYHSRQVTVTGFLVLEFEGNALYPLEDFAKYNMMNGIRIKMNEEIKEKRNELHLCYVKITGKFDALDRGRGTFVGTIKKIDKISLADVGVMSYHFNHQKNNDEDSHCKYYE